MNLCGFSLANALANHLFGHHSGRMPLLVSPILREQCGIDSSKITFRNRPNRANNLRVVDSHRLPGFDRPRPKEGHRFTKSTEPTKRRIAHRVLSVVGERARTAVAHVPVNRQPPVSSVFGNEENLVIFAATADWTTTDEIRDPVVIFLVNAQIKALVHDRGGRLADQVSVARSRIRRQWHRGRTGFLGRVIYCTRAQGKRRYDQDGRQSIFDPQHFNPRKWPSKPSFWKLEIFTI